MYVNIVKTDRCLLIGLSIHSGQLSPGQHQVAGRGEQNAAINHVSCEIRILWIRRRDIDFNRAGCTTPRATTQGKELGRSGYLPAGGVIPLDEGWQHRRAGWDWQLDAWIQRQRIHWDSVHVQSAVTRNPVSVCHPLFTTLQHCQLSTSNSRPNCLLIAITGTPHDALAPYPWSCSVNWCQAESYRNGDECCPMGLMARERLYGFYAQMQELL